MREEQAEPGAPEELGALEEPAAPAGLEALVVQEAPAALAAQWGLARLFFPMA